MGADNSSTSGDLDVFVDQPTETIDPDQSLAELVRAGKITFDVALERAANADDLRRLLGR